MCFPSLEYKNLNDKVQKRIWTIRRVTLNGDDAWKKVEKPHGDVWRVGTTAWRGDASKKNMTRAQLEKGRSCFEVGTHLVWPEFY